MWLQSLCGFLFLSPDLGLCVSVLVTLLDEDHLVKLNEKENLKHFAAVTSDVCGVQHLLWKMSMMSRPDASSRQSMCLSVLSDTPSAPLEVFRSLLGNVGSH